MWAEPTPHTCTRKAVQECCGNTVFSSKEKTEPRCMSINWILRWSTKSTAMGNNERRALISTDLSHNVKWNKLQENTNKIIPLYKALKHTKWYYRPLRDKNSFGESKCMKIVNTKFKMMVKGTRQGNARLSLQWEYFLRWTVAWCSSLYLYLYPN